MLEKTENPTVTSLNGSKNEDTDNNPQIRNVNTSDEETDTPTNRFTKSRKRIQKFSESDSDENIVDDTFPICTDHAQSNTSSDSDETSSSLINKSKKSRLKTIDDSGSDFDSNYDLKILPKTKEHSLCSVSSHESDSNSESTKATKNKEQQIRMKNKRSKLKNKFKSLLSSRNKSAIGNKEDSSHDNEANASMSEISGNEESSLENIKKTLQIKKEKTTSLKMSICDPDISDEENDKPKHKSKMPQRQTKATSPKPLRMSAKQAMENMQKIKSESNRMLREKEVSLPYHRPKALNLKDIMSRRRPALSADGKVLPIKMNEEQLRQYANQLELRQKDMMELCKSETEDEDDEGNTNENPKDADAPNSISTTENGLISSKIDINSAELPEASNDLICNNVTDSNSLPCTGNPELPNEITCNNIVDEIELNEENVCEKSEDVSAEMQLVYNDSVEECTENCGDGSSNLIAYNTQETEEPIKNMSLENETHIQADSVVTDTNRIDLEKSHDNNTKCTVRDSQIILLQYDTEDTEVIKSDLSNLSKHDKSNNCGVSGIELPSDLVETSAINEFPNDDMEINDINMDELDNIIQNAEAVKDADVNNYKNSPASVRDSPNLNIKPKLTGEPGMVIDLDGNDPIAPRKLSGVELLKERFTFYAKLKTPEELERDRERRQKPGTQHIKLKQELEDKIAEQRSLEWAKRLENEKQQQEELDAIRGDDISDTENDIDKIEEKLQDNDLEDRESSEESEEEEEIEDDVFIEDKPRKISALIADEAEESDDEDADQNNDENDDDEDGNVDNNEIEDKKADEDESSSEDEESSESEAENESKPRKRRILKAFEDSDDEEAAIIKDDNPISVSQIIESENIPMVTKQNIPDSQDDDLQLAQAPKSMSDDIFVSPVSNMNNASSMETTQAVHKTMDEVELGTQTFSIMSSNTLFKSNLDLELNGSEKLNVIAETQNNDNLDAVVGMCSGSFSQNCLDIQPPTTQTQQLSIGEDLLDMCTGKFYDSEFVSQSEEKVAHTSDDMSQDSVFCLSKDKTQTKAELSKEEIEKTKEESQKKVEGDILKSVLDELDEPVEANKPLKYFFDGKNYKENEPNVYNTQLKKKFVIDSDDENSNVDSVEKKKKVKKKKPEKRALQISDDEDEYSEQEVDEHLSEDDELIDNAGENLVEYDSEENEIEVKEAKLKKKKKVAEFFEREAELSSEDEWAGSGDEDERGLDRLEREAGDDDAFHLGRLQRQLGHIHMREVLDQDKREVRIIQELLFEDGDLGGGGRQRKFRWRNADGEEETGTVPDQLADTQEEEFESEELWRKQRHEREVFLRQMKNGDEEQDQNITINRTSIIKANLHSRAMSSLLEEAANKAANDTVKSPPAPEKKTVNDIPSPKKSFPVFKHNYHGSLLTRGRGALARLAALATPLAVDDDAPKTLAASSKRNFVFATLTPEEKGPKVTKRKAETNIGTPRLVKKMKTVEKQKAYKNSLLDHLKT